MLVYWGTLGNSEVGVPMQPATRPGMAQKAEKSEEDVQRLQQEKADSEERLSVVSGPWPMAREHKHSRIFLMSS